ncbi:MAG: LacI family DNA-binding transcriptional regulator, partial [Acidobacteriota bacterium]
RKPTMSDVARLAGVGTMTVSRVLSGTTRVSAATAQRVQTAIAQLKYRPNELARAFRGHCSHSIGLIVPYLYDPFFANCAQAVTAVARERGYSVILTTSGEDPEIEYAEAEQMLLRHVDGLAVIPARTRQSRLTRAFLGKTPMVVFDRPASDRSIDVVLVQNAAGSRRMTEHLLEHGHRRIAFIGLSRNLFTINARFQGYRQAMQQAGLREEFSFDCDSAENTLRTLKNQLEQKERPTAVFTSNTLVTRYFLEAVARLGIQVPRELAFAAFDDFDLAEFTSPPLTVVRQPALEMGRAATNLLLDRIAQGRTPEAGARLVLPVEIVLRRSCGCKHRTPVVMK